LIQGKSHGENVRRPQVQVNLVEGAIGTAGQLVMGVSSDAA
jgi:hypothetical protein